MVLIGGGAASWTTTECWVRFVADSNGKWVCEFNARGTTDSVAAGTIYLNSVTADSTSNFFQACSAGSGSSTFTATCIAGYSATYGNTLFLNAPQATTDWRLSGRFLLQSEPTIYTTAANMEGVLAADVFIPPAAAGIAGLVNNTAGNTVGTPIKGRTDGQAVEAGYVGEPKTAASVVAAAGTDAWYDITSQELTAGNWLILGGFKFVSSSAVGANTQTLSRITYNAGADSVIGKNSFYEDGDATKNYANFAYCYNVNFTGANRTYAIQGRWSAGAGNPLFYGHLTAIRLP